MILHILYILHHSETRYSCSDYLCLSKPGSQSIGNENCRYLFSFTVGDESGNESEGDINDGGDFTDEGDEDDTDDEGDADSWQRCRRSGRFMCNLAGVQQ